jgi:metal-dependent amidase/aminoacylase/carboxypeptidase family protein
MNILLSILIVLAFSISMFCQVGEDTELYRAVLSKDDLLFNVGFNTCDIKKFETLLSEKFEFYHDTDGFSDRSKFLADLKNGLCKDPANYQARRELIPQSTEIYALNSKTGLYGAIQNGVHQFFEKQGKGPEKFGSSAKFTHLWLLENGEWKLAKSYSFEHQKKLLSAEARPESAKYNVNSTHESIKLETNKIFEKLVSLRREFHQNPELSGKEMQTQETIVKYLSDLGLEVKTDIYGYGVVGILRGAKEGRNIAWRAEMDALASDFPDDVAFKSKVRGVQHGCGHDVHLAIALGIAEILAKHRKSLHGTVFFVFQPEEETFAGAKKMIENGLFSSIKPDEFYGLHVTALPVGQIMVKPNEMFAYQKRIRIALKNTISNDQANELKSKIKRSLSRSQTGSRPWEIQNVVDAKLGLASSETIFRDYLIIDESFNSYSRNETLFLEAYLYETNPNNLKDIVPKINQVIEAVGLKDYLLSVSIVQENPTVVNDPKLTDTASKTLERIFGKGLVSPSFGQVPFFNDDFAYFQQKVPGVYFFLGGSNFENGVIAMNHSPNFQVDEESIRTGVKSFSSLIVERLKTEND